MQLKLIGLTLALIGSLLFEYKLSVKVNELNTKLTEVRTELLSSQTNAITFHNAVNEIESINKSQIDQLQDSMESRLAPLELDVEGLKYIFGNGMKKNKK